MPTMTMETARTVEYSLIECPDCEGEGRTSFYRCDDCKLKRQKRPTYSNQECPVCFGWLEYDLIDRCMTCNGEGKLTQERKDEQ